MCMVEIDYAFGGLLLCLLLNADTGMFTVENLFWHIKWKAEFTSKISLQISPMNCENMKYETALSHN